MYLAGDGEALALAEGERLADGLRDLEAEAESLALGLNDLEAEALDERDLLSEALTEAEAEEDGLKDFDADADADADGPVGAKEADIPIITSEVAVTPMVLDPGGETKAVALYSPPPPASEIIRLVFKPALIVWRVPKKAPICNAPFKTVVTVVSKLVPVPLFSITLLS